MKKSQKNSKKSATPVHKESAHGKSHGNEERLVDLQIEYPKSNLRKLTEIAARFRARYDDLIDQGYFTDLQKEFAAIMKNEPNEHCLVGSLEFKIYDYGMYITPMPIGESLIRFRKSEKMGVHRGETFIQSFLIGNEIVIASCEVCPACGHEWRQKTLEHTCPRCERSLGVDMFFVIEEDKCPHCNHKGITESGMVCRNCHREIYEETVVRLKLQI